MTNYLQQFLFKWKFAVLILVLTAAMIAGFSCWVNRYLPKYAHAYCNLIGQQLSEKFSFGEIHYGFPNRLILKNVQVLPLGKGTPMLKISRMVMGLSLPLSSSGPAINYVALNDATIDFALLKDYWDEHRPSLYAWARTLPQSNLRFFLPDGQIYLKSKTRDPNHFKIYVDLKQDHVLAHGTWDDKKKYDYVLSGNLIDHGFNLTKLTITEGESSINLWGQWQNNNIDWKGFILYKQIYILDISGHLNIRDTAIVLKDLSFSVNGDDVDLTGQCSKQKFFQCTADLTVSRQKKHLTAQMPVKDISFHLESQNTPQGPFFNGQADLKFLFKANPSFAIPHARLSFKNLKGRIINASLLQLRMDRLEAAWSGPDEHQVLAEDLLAGIHLTGNSHATITLSTRLYAGHYRSRFFLDTTSLPWQIVAQGQFEDIDINRIKDTLPFFRSYHGLLSGNVDLQSLKNMKLRGALLIRHGNFNDPHFLPWVARTLQMPTLEHLSAAEMSCHFSMDGLSKKIDDLHLQTDDMDLKGSFHLDEEDFVSSRLAVRFSKALLSESPMGRSIIGMVQEAWTLPFEFRLSGNLYRMNFQWDHSPLKDKVRQHMFAFVERMIDRRADANPYTAPQSPAFKVPGP